MRGTGGGRKERGVEERRKVGEMRETGDKGKKGEKGERKEKRSGRILPPVHLYCMGDNSVFPQLLCYQLLCITLSNIVYLKLS
jgi:hypothetical protein